jgi:hypothetical protein
MGHRRSASIMCYVLRTAPIKHYLRMLKCYLPEDRADRCDGEYEQVAYAFKTLIVTLTLIRLLQAKC